MRGLHNVPSHIANRPTTTFGYLHPHCDLQMRGEQIGGGMPYTAVGIGGGMPYTAVGIVDGYI